MIEIRPLDFGSPTDVDAFHQVDSGLRALVWPDDLPPSRDALVKEHTTLPDFVTARRWLAWEGDRAVGQAYARWRAGVDNQHLAVGYAGVLPEWRRQGLGTRLVGTATKAASAAGRTSIIFDSDSRSEGGDVFLEGLGGKKSLVERLSRLEVSELDRDLMRAWADVGEEKLATFEILLWNGRVPAEHVEAFAKLHDVMNSAPFEDLDVEPFVLTPEQLIAQEDSWLARGIRWWCAVARHRESGEFAGFTDIAQMPDRPERLDQWGTGVWHKYRRNGLGRWLKAVNAMRVLEIVPDVRWFQTGNAGTNQAMLAINEAMGYKPYKHITAWQFEIAGLLPRTGSLSESSR